MTIKIAVLAFDGISAFHLSVPCMVFGDAARAAGIEKFEVTVCSEVKGRIRTSSGFSIHTDESIECFEQADVIIVPSWSDTNLAPSQQLTNALNAANKRKALVVGLCLGAFPLAYAGLLDNKVATSHWAYLDEFAARFPTILLSPDSLYQQDDNLLTSAGTAAAIDCCLFLVRQFCGTANTNALARLMVTAPHRTGGQAQFIQFPMPQSIKDQRLANTLLEINANLAARYTVNSVADSLNMSRRSFTRHFRAAIGASFTDWLITQRLRYAQELLETSQLSIERISECCGFTSGLSFRQHFRQRFGVTPKQWRVTFQQIDDASS